MRVLIVDKEPPDRSALANVVATRKDVEVCASAENATDALDKLQKEEYDILLLDGPMSEMSEIELVGRLKKRHRLMPAVIFVTARRHHAITGWGETFGGLCVEAFLERENSRSPEHSNS